jgi:hypothetical protein
MRIWRIDAREEVTAQEQHQHGKAEHEGHEGDYKGRTVRQRHRQQLR